MPPWAISAQAVRAIHCPATHACMCERDVSQCHGDQHSWLPGQHARQPGSLGSTPAPDGHPCNGHIADDEETPQIALPHLRRPAKPGLAPRRVLAWRQADPEPAPDPIRGREIPSLCEALPWRSQCRECDGRDRPNARNRHQPPRDIVFRGDLPDLRRQSIDLPRQIVDLLQQQLAKRDDRHRKRVGRPVQDVSEARKVLRTLRCHKAMLGHGTARAALIVCVLCPVSRSRVFRTIAWPCCSASFTATNRIEGRDAASAIASASAASFFCRFT